jgi:hypothetical protein
VQTWEVTCLMCGRPHCAHPGGHPLGARDCQGIARRLPTERPASWAVMRCTHCGGNATATRIGGPAVLPATLRQAEVAA